MGPVRERGEGSALCVRVFWIFGLLGFLSPGCSVASLLPFLLVFSPLSSLVRSVLLCSAHLVAREKVRVCAWADMNIDFSHVLFLFRSSLRKVLKCQLEGKEGGRGTETKRERARKRSGSGTEGKHRGDDMK